MTPISDPDHIPVHLIVDLPSLLCAARALADTIGEPEGRIEIHAAHLKQVMAAGRDVEGSTVIADQSLSEGELAPFRRCFDHVFAVNGSSDPTEAVDRLLRDTVSLIADRAVAGATVVVAAAENAKGVLGANLSASLVCAIERHVGIELLALDRSARGVLREMQRGLGILVLLDPFFDSITYLEGGRSALGQAVRARPAMDLTPWDVAARDATEILNGRPVDSIPWRRWRSIPKFDLEERRDLVGWLREVGPDGDLEAALDRFGLRPSREDRLVRNFEAIIHALQPPDGGLEGMI